MPIDNLCHICHFVDVLPPEPGLEFNYRIVGGPASSKFRLSGTNIIFIKGPLKTPYLFYFLTGYCGPVTEHPVLFKIHPATEYLSSEEALLKSANHHDKKQE